MTHRLWSMLYFWYLEFFFSCSKHKYTPKERQREKWREEKRREVYRDRDSIHRQHKIMREIHANKTDFDRLMCSRKKTKWEREKKKMKFSALKRNWKSVCHTEWAFFSRLSALILSNFLSNDVDWNSTFVSNWSDCVCLSNSMKRTWIKWRRRTKKGSVDLF